MSTRLLAFTLIIGFASPTLSQEVDARKLCALIRTPREAIMLGIGLSTERGFILAGETIDNSARIAALEKALCGDATDAERYYQLSQLYNDAEKGKRAAARAIALFTAQVQQDPGNGRLTLRLGQSLDAARDKDREAEKLLRQAVELAPKDAECWHALGDFLWAKSFATLVRGSDRKAAGQLAILVQIIVTRTVPQEHLLLSRKIAREASLCMDRAVAAAPRQSRYYIARALVHALAILLEEGGRAVVAEKNDILETILRVSKQLSRSRTFADLQKAAELDPANPRALVVAGICEAVPQFDVLLSKLKEGDAATREITTREIQIQAVRLLSSLIPKLDALTTHREKRTAAEACFLEALLLAGREALTSKDAPNAAEIGKVEQLLRRAVTLAPDNESAWDVLLMVLLKQQNKEKELSAACEARLRVKDNARNRFFAAKALVELDRYDEAEKHLRAGVGSDGNSTINHVGLAAVLLRSGNPAHRAEAGKHLDRAEELLRRTSNDALAEDVAVLRAVLVALSGQSATARQMLRAVLDKNKNHDMAGQMLPVLGEKIR